MTEQQSPDRRPAGRSPSYPAINLETALRRARELYDVERQHPIPVETAVRHLGYKGISGPANGTVAALKKFGLITDEGSGTERRVRITNLCVEALANPDADARAAAIRRVALTPAIHREMWNQYGTNLPSDATLVWNLERQRGFTPVGAKDFIREYKETVAFARLAEAVATLDERGDDGDGDDADNTDDEREDPPREKPGSKRRREHRMSADAATYTIPLVGGVSVVIEGEFPLTERDWQQFLAVLNAMKPGLVESESED